MPLDPDVSILAIFILVFISTGCVGFFLFLRSYGDQRRAIERLRNLAKPDDECEKSNGALRFVRAAIPKLGTHMLPNREDRLASLNAKFVRAGYFHIGSARTYMGVKLVLLLALPVVFAAIPFALGLLDLRWALVVSAVASAIGTFGPDVWLHGQIRKRQQLLRRGLPDALDMLVLCVEGGLTFNGALMRVTSEMIAVHPALAVELTIIEREIHLGATAGKAIQHFAERCGLDEVRDLASVLIQSERYGASIVKTLRTHADSYRYERQQQLEETAQKAAVKILFPTLLCIFPAIFIVVLGPAAFQIAELFAK